jgi:hypothetical protein
MLAVVRRVPQTQVLPLIAVGVLMVGARRSTNSGTNPWPWYAATTWPGEDVPAESPALAS